MGAYQGLGATHQEAVCEVRKKKILSGSSSCDDAGRIPLSALRSQGFAESFEALEQQGIIEKSSGVEEIPKMAYYANPYAPCGAHTADH